MNKDVVVLIPVFNPDIKIMNKFLNELDKEFINIVLINDGSSIKYSNYFNKLEKKYPVIKHNINLGKGRGLKDGLNYILNNYKNIKVIVTADCDGQHSPTDIKRCASFLKSNMESLVLGVRKFTFKNIPFRSFLGNVFTRGILYFLTGQKVSDTQTGLRAMSPLTAKKLLDVSGERYEYETNVLIASKCKNIPIKELDIDTIYISDNKTSHFNPIKDSLRVYNVFASFILWALFAYLVELFIFKNTYNINNAFYIIPLFLFLSKLVSSLIKIIFNNYVNILYVLINYILSIIILSFLDVNILLFKVLIDIIMFFLSIFLYNWSTKKG